MVTKFPNFMVCFTGSDSDSGGASGWIQAGATLAAAGLGYLGQSNLNKKNREWNAEQAALQRQWSEQMYERQLQDNLHIWQMQNEYNDPMSQKQRMLEAGLNPLYYGLDGSSAQQVQSAQPMQYERASYNAVQNPIAAGIDTAAKIAAIENTRSDTAKKNQETLTEERRRELLIQQKEESIAKVRKYLASANLDDKQREKIEQYLQYGDELYQAMIDRENSYADLNQATKDRLNKLLPGELELQKMSVEDYKHKWKKWNAEINHLVAQDKVLAKQAKFYLVDMLSNGVFGSGVSAVNGYILDLIEDDPDLSDVDKDNIARGFNMSKKSKKRFWNNAKDISDSVDDTGFVPSNYGNRDYSLIN